MEIKEMVVKARKAQEIYEHHFDQDQVDRVIREAARVHLLIMPKNWPGWL